MALEAPREGLSVSAPEGTAPAPRSGSSMADGDGVGAALRDDECLFGGNQEVQVGGHTLLRETQHYVLDCPNSLSINGIRPDIVLAS